MPAVAKIQRILDLLALGCTVDRTGFRLNYFDCGISAGVDLDQLPGRRRAANQIAAISNAAERVNVAAVASGAGSARPARHFFAIAGVASTVRSAAKAHSQRRMEARERQPPTISAQNA
jgi:hypothetical protein